MSNPYKITEPTCISFSGGRTSAFMLWQVILSGGGQLPCQAVVCFANTGKEDEATLRFIQDCSEHWNVPITWLEYQQLEPRFKVVNFQSANRDGTPFEQIIEQRGGVLPNRVSRFCSSELKTRTMHRYLKHQGWTEWNTLIGIRADEPRRVSKFRANPKPEGKHEEVWMPLAVEGVSAQEVGAFWRSQPFDLELPNIQGKTMHGNCDLCYLKPATQVLSLIIEQPSRAIWWAAQEAKAETVALSAARFSNNRPSYASMAKFTEQQRDMFDADEEAIACFCGD
jgi:3'-phosphoadenosine 5'-phosphosulfate sulfotransferase (PAPS reductase)/FAD synthetase